MQTYSVEVVDWAEYLPVLRQIRTEVFIQEQQVPRELEWDDKDELALHVLARDGEDEPVGTGRLLATGQIGRMAVLRKCRSRGAGSAIMNKLMQLARERRYDHLFLNAQVEAIPFYRRFGFVEQGPEFMEAGIAHRKMVYLPGRETSAP